MDNIPDLRNNILVLFDVDGTITPARQNIENEMDEYLQTLRTRVSVGLVGGSDLEKIADQVQDSRSRSTGKNPIDCCLQRFDFVFAENGLVAYEGSEILEQQSLINHLGEDNIQTFINFCLAYMSTLRIPKKRGNFIEFRNGLINVCPVGRSCSQEERAEFAAYDKEHKIREKFIDQLLERFGPGSENPIDLVYSIGGQISFDAFPKNWDKTFCLKFVEQRFEKIYFFGDKTHKGGNDFEIFSDSRTIGHSVLNPRDTLCQLEKLGFAASRENC